MTVEENDAATTGSWADAYAPVVVAVDGSERNRSAVAWAATEAALNGCELALVTVVEHVLPVPHFSVRSQVQEALDMLNDVAREVRQLVPEQLIRTEAVEGSLLELLLDRARHARLVVVGKRGLSSFARVIVGSTSIALAGRSSVPVTIVPDGWTQQTHAKAPVVLGIDPYKPQHTPIHLAFSRARKLKVPLVAVHGWEPPSVFEWDGAAVADAQNDLEQQANDAFDKLLDPWSKRFPDVDLEAVHAHSHPAMAVLAEAERAQLVVLGRHTSTKLGGFAFGSVTRAVLHYSECPVLVVPADDE